MQHRLLQAILEQMPVGKSSQSIVVCLILHLCKQALVVLVGLRPWLYWR
ncbi:hypothetical protein DEDE109153_00050 [Deinococcus deserti]|nr:hypothetical protein [Deinococcus deserti]